MTRRVIIDAAKFSVAMAAIEVGRLKTYGVETNSDATTCQGNLFGLRKQA